METKKKKKILFVITKSNFGGAQRYVFEIANALKEKGHNVAIASGGKTGALIEKCREARITHLPLKQLERDIGLKKELVATHSLYSTIADFKPDIVHLNSSKAGGLGALVARLLGVKNIVFTAHGWPFREQRAWWWKAIVWFLSFCTGLLVHKVIVVSQKDYDDCPTALVRNKATVIYTGVSQFPTKNCDQARSLLYPKNTAWENSNSIWLISIAELTSNKNLAYAISAVAAYNRIHDHKYFYSIVGTGEEHDFLQDLIKKEKAENEIRLLGFKDEARQYLPAFDVFLLPSKKEGMPYVILEAAMTGLPVIASNTGGIPEFITDKQTGYLIDSQDTNTLQRALELSADKSHRKELGVAAQHKIADFSLDRMLSKTFTLYGIK